MLWAQTLVTTVAGAHANVTAMSGVSLAAKSANIPVEQPTLFELAINPKAAKGRGLAIPQALLLRTDEVIQ